MERDQKEAENFPKASQRFNLLALRSGSYFLLFVLTYFALVSIVVLINILVWMIPFPTITNVWVIAIYLLSKLGVLGLFVFMFKFIFNESTNNEDVGVKIRVKKEDEPELFNCIESVAKKARIKMPKEVFLTNENNASVTFKHPNLALFFPVSKQLNVGLPLINNLSISELEFVIGHEFGHFSQFSMRVSSYLEKGRIISGRMIFHDGKWEHFIESLASSFYFMQFLSNILNWITNTIKGILFFFFKKFEKHFVELRHEMEFNADQVGAYCSGNSVAQQFFLKSERLNNSFNDGLKSLFLGLESGVKIQFLFSYLGKYQSTSEQIYTYLSEIRKSIQPNPQTLLNYTDSVTHPSDANRFNQLSTGNNYRRDLNTSSGLLLMSKNNQTDDLLSSFWLENLKLNEIKFPTINAFSLTSEEFELFELNHLRIHTKFNSSFYYRTPNLPLELKKSEKISNINDVILEISDLQNRLLQKSYYLFEINKRFHEQGQLFKLNYKNKEYTFETANLLYRELTEDYNHFTENAFKDADEELFSILYQKCSEVESKETTKKYFDYLKHLIDFKKSVNEIIEFIYGFTDSYSSVDDVSYDVELNLVNDVNERIKRTNHLILNHLDSLNGNYDYPHISGIINRFFPKQRSIIELEYPVLRNGLMANKFNELSFLSNELQEIILRIVSIICLKSDLKLEQLEL